MSIIYVAITSGSTFTIPSDFHSFQAAYAIGAGSVCGGAYAVQLSPTGFNALIHNGVINVHIGTGSGTQGNKNSPGTADTWLGSANTFLYAQGAAPNLDEGEGLASACFPTLNAASGGDISVNGSGGAGGPNGPGQTSSGAYGGAGDNGYGGAGGEEGGYGGGNGSNGGNGTEWLINGINYGCGGGGGAGGQGYTGSTGSAGGPGQNGGNGGPGGNGGNGGN